MKQSHNYEINGCRRLLCAVLILGVMDLDSKQYEEEAAAFFASDLFAQMARNLDMNPVNMARKIKVRDYLKPHRRAYHTSNIVNRK